MPHTMEKGESSRTNVELDLDPLMPLDTIKAGPAEDTISIPVDQMDAIKVLQICSHLNGELGKNLVDFLKNKLDVFAWCHADMIGIDPEVMCHHLNIDPTKKRMRQKTRPVSGERAQALKDEVDRLMGAGLIKEYFYSTWLTNPVLVRKPN